MKTIYSTIRILALGLLVCNSKLVLSQNQPLVRLMMKSGNSSDETVFYFQQGGTTAFQSDFDAYKLPSGNAPYIGSLSDSILTSISGLPALPVNLSIPVKAISPVTKTFTFSAEQTNFPDDVCVTLYDAFTGQTINILSTNYECVLYDSTTAARFTMNFFSSNLNATSVVKQADCNSPGMISVQGAGGPWDYEWSIGDSIIRTCTNKSSPDSLLNLNGGSYTVKISRKGECASFSKTFDIAEVNPSKADFSPDVYVTTLSNSGMVNFTNHSHNAQFSIWNFGDKSGTYYIPSPSHNYTSAGFYTVTLIAESNSHCQDTAIQIVQVIDDVTGISELAQNNKLTLVTLDKGEFELQISLNKTSDLHLTMMDANGNLLRNLELKQVSIAKQPVSLNDLPSGLYLLKVSDKKQERVFKLVH